MWFEIVRWKIWFFLFSFSSDSNALLPFPNDDASTVCCLHQHLSLRSTVEQNNRSQSLSLFISLKPSALKKSSKVQFSVVCVIFLLGYLMPFVMMIGGILPRVSRWHSSSCTCCDLLSHIVVWDVEFCWNRPEKRWTVIECALNVCHQFTRDEKKIRNLR